MSKAPPIGELMVGQPYTIQYEETCSAAERLMAAHRIRHLPVVDGKRVMGILSEKDISFARNVYKGRQFDGEILVKDICLFESCTVASSEPLDAVARMMATQRLDAVIVVDNETPVGIFTTTDACRLLADNFEGVRKRGFWERLFR